MAFIGLGASSFWADELFTAYFADPVQKSFHEVILRAAEDVHPPGYYLLVWAGVRSTGLEFVVASRGVSAVLAVVALALLMLAPPRPVGLTPRLVAAAFAATSYLWFAYSQEARSYALCFVLVTGIVGLGLQCLERLQKHETPGWWLAGVAVLSLLACLTHYYMVPLTGAIFTMLLCFCRTWRSGAAVSLAGLAVLAGTVAYLKWHLSQTVVNIEDTWFSAEWSFLITQIRMGVGELLGGFWSRAFLALCVGLAVLRDPRALWAVLREDQLWAPIAFLAGAFLLTVGYGIGVTMTFTPMFSFRLFILLVPMIWIGVAYAVYLDLRLMKPGWPLSAASILMAFVLVVAAPIMTLRSKEDGQAWRQSAQAVAALDTCRDAILPVMWWDQSYFREDHPDRFYGFYLPASDERAWIIIPRHKAAEELAGAQMKALVQATAAGTRSCPIVLWSVHMHGQLSLEQMQDLLQAHVPEESGLSIKAQVLLPPDASYWMHGRLFTLE